MIALKYSDLHFNYHCLDHLGYLIIYHSNCLNNLTFRLLLQRFILNHCCCFMILNLHYFIIIVAAIAVFIFYSVIALGHIPYILIPSLIKLIF